jgi:UDP-N-acetylmuramoylalanine--D-glutamate ligase
MEKYKNKKVLIVGLGLQGSGVGLVRFFHKIGATVGITDLKTAEKLSSSIDQIKEVPLEIQTFGEHKLEDFLWADYIIKGPAMPWTHPLIIEAQKQGKIIEMEIGIFFENCKNKIIGVTGTRGKSTTTAMIYEILKSKYTVHLAGNTRMISTISLLENMKQDDLVLLELSSWQLSSQHKVKLSPHIAVFTNMYPDHMNYYKNIEEYFYDKKAIYMYQKSDDVLIANKNLKNEIDKDDTPSRKIFFDSEDFTGELSIKGVHNLENAACALFVAQEFGILPSEAKKILFDFKGLPYRLEKISSSGGFDIYNDTTSTTPVATMIAINALKDKKILLMLGGTSKNLPFEELISLINEKDGMMVVLLAGSFTCEIISKIRPEIILNKDPFTNLEEAVKYAISNIGTCDTILFSPGATSFEMFKNEFHRGEEFNRIVGDYEKDQKLI